MRWKKLWDDHLVVRVCANAKSNLKAAVACKEVEVNLAQGLQLLQGWWGSPWPGVLQGWNRRQKAAG